MILKLLYPWVWSTNPQINIFTTVGRVEGGVWGLNSADGFGGDTPDFFKLMITWWILKIEVVVEGNTRYIMYPKNIYIWNTKFGLFIVLL